MYYGRKVGYCFKWGEHHTALFPCKSLVFKPKEGNPWFLALSWRRKWQPTPVFLPGESRDGVAQSRTQLKWLSSKTVNLSQYQDNFYFSRVWLQIFECSLLGGHYGKIRHYPSNSSLEFMPVNIYIKKKWQICNRSSCTFHSNRETEFTMKHRFREKVYFSISLNFKQYELHIE